MNLKATTVAEYMAVVPAERQPYFYKLREIILDNIPKGFVEQLSYGMPGYVVPHNTYPDGYHCDPTLPLPFVSIASQKNFVALYHMGIYADKDLHDWFVGEYPKHCKRKLDMGKSCIRFKKMEEIPYALIGQLIKKMKVKDWIKVYENKVKG